MSCHQAPQDSSDLPQVALIGPPNVGKSVIFNALTGLRVTVANYAGSTVDVAMGRAVLGGRSCSLCDLPGTYSLEAGNQAEAVAIDMLGKPLQAVIVLLDALHIEASIHLLLQILAYGHPTLALVNRMDLAAARGLPVDVQVLADHLQRPVVGMVATQGVGFEALQAALRQLFDQGGTQPSYTQPQDPWLQAESLAAQMRQAGLSAQPSLATPSRSGDASALIRVWPGLPIALLVLTVTFAAIIGVGMGLRQMLLLPLFRGHLFPLIEDLVRAWTTEGLLRQILIGDYGMLIKGLEWPLALVLPYILSFYVVISILEDSGYLPRMAVLGDGLLSRLGIRGSHGISLLLSCGCAIPGILSTRAMGTRRERIIVTTLITLAVPCVAQSSALIAMLGEVHWVLVPLLALLAFLIMLVTGICLSRLLPGERSQLVVELPELLRPQWRVILSKLLAHLRHYLYDGALPMIAAVGLASVLYESGVLSRLGEWMSPLISGWLRLPAEAAGPLLLGIIRRELTVLPLLEMDLSPLQVFVGAVVGLLYVPCIAVVVVILREFGYRVALATLGLSIFTAFFLGGVIAQLGALLWG